MIVSKSWKPYTDHNESHTTELSKLIKWNTRLRLINATSNKHALYISSNKYNQYQSGFLISLELIKTARDCWSYTVYKCLQIFYHKLHDIFNGIIVVKIYLLQPKLSFVVQLRQVMKNHIWHRVFFTVDKHYWIYQCSPNDVRWTCSRE